MSKNVVPAKHVVTCSELYASTPCVFNHTEAMEEHYKFVTVTDKVVKTNRHNPG